MNQNKRTTKTKETLPIIMFSPDGELLMNTKLSQSQITNSCLTAVAELTKDFDDEKFLRVVNAMAAVYHPAVVFGTKEELQKELDIENESLADVERNEEIDKQIAELKEKVKADVEKGKAEN